MRYIICMKKYISCLLVLIMTLGCGEQFEAISAIPNDPPIPRVLTELEILEQSVQLLKDQHLVKEMNFDSADGLVNGASVLDGEVTLENPSNNDQYVDTGVSIKDLEEATLSVWIKTEDPAKVQKIFGKEFLVKMDGELRHSTLIPLNSTYPLTIPVTQQPPLFQPF